MSSPATTFPFSFKLFVYSRSHLFILSLLPSFTADAILVLRSVEWGKPFWELFWLLFANALLTKLWIVIVFMNQLIKQKNSLLFIENGTLIWQSHRIRRTAEETLKGFEYRIESVSAFGMRRCCVYLYGNIRRRKLFDEESLQRTFRAYRMALGQTVKADKVYSLKKIRIQRCFIGLEDYIRNNQNGKCLNYTTKKSASIFQRGGFRK